MAPSTLTVPDQIEELFGRRDLARDAGLVHVTALSLRPDGYRTIVIDGGSPRSPRDFFSLQLTRARADAIIISGKLLRDEPTLNYQLRGPKAEALRSWRKLCQERHSPPHLLILTRSGALPSEHPIFESSNPVTVLSDEKGAAEAARRLPSTRVRADASPGIASAIAVLADEGATTISLEAGPSTSRIAYEESLVDELMLSTFYGPFPLSMNETAAPFERAQLEVRLASASAPARFEEGSGAWSFERRTR